mmetsp:Transcript_25680/g.64578  ORF Transcript_25680/g.64578 Transcript_25680/m.64578 type:complete len:197 (+) Transcript_25680:306-896(+)
MTSEVVQCLKCDHRGPVAELDEIVDQPETYICREDDCADGLYCVKCNQLFSHDMTSFGSPDPDHDDLGRDKYICKDCFSSFRCSLCSGCDLAFLPDDSVTEKGKNWCEECWAEELEARREVEAARRREMEEVIKREVEEKVKQMAMEGNRSPDKKKGTSARVTKPVSSTRSNGSTVSRIRKPHKARKSKEDKGREA